MYELVPPTSKLIDFETPYLKDVVFNLKVFNFEEDEQYQELLMQSEGKYSEDIYIDLFKLGVDSIKGVEGKFTPNWRVIKSVVNKIISINTVTELEK
jgi:hypothetical protein